VSPSSPRLCLGLRGVERSIWEEEGLRNGVEVCEDEAWVDVRSGLPDDRPFEGEPAPAVRSNEVASLALAERPVPLARGEPFRRIRCKLD
jgi:hypothetical protein